MPIRCLDCGYEGNREIARYCRSCGGQLKGPQLQSNATPVKDSTPETRVPGEAMVHFNFAKGRMLSIEEEDPSGWRDVANELALAVEKAGGNFPKAHALMGVSLAMLGDVKSARKEFLLTIKQDSFNVLAHAMMILIDLDSFGTSRLPLIGGWTDILMMGIGAVADRSKVGHIRTQVDELIRAFQESIRRSDDLKDWISISDLMLQVHNAVQGVVDPKKKRLLAQVILDAPWDGIDIPSDLLPDVEEIHSQAEAHLT